MATHAPYPHQDKHSFLDGFTLNRGRLTTALILIALGIEVAWEILENTPLVIERYRSGTISLGYQGDSIVNSVADALAMSFGFFLASRLPVAISVLLVIVLELFVVYFVRDNLFLNVLMLLHPLDPIREWQAALPSR